MGTGSGFEAARGGTAIGAHTGTGGREDWYACAVGKALEDGGMYSVSTFAG